ncbi:MAG: hypothetical protein HZA06_03580 [Nitrospirae bacterium]|nr:hypothetical protein [Nitrospirota bacterium]
MAILIITFFAFLLNLIFGVLRAGTKSFSLRWFLYIHIPVLIIIPIRLQMGLGSWYILYLIAASFSGQYLGVLLGRYKKGLYD